MKITIGRLDDDNIFTGRDYSDIRDKGELAHIIAELESIKLDLIGLWDKINECEGEECD